MPNAFYNSTGNPGTNSPGLSATIRAEFAAIAAGFDKLPSTFVANRPVVVNAGGTALTLAGGGLILAGDLTTSGAFNTTLVQQATVTLTLPAVNGTLATLAGTETLSNKTLVAPALGTPASGVLTNCTGLPAASVVAGALADDMTATTQSAGDSSTKLATDAFVAAALAGYIARIQVFTSSDTYTPHAKMKFGYAVGKGGGGSGGGSNVDPAFSYGTGGGGEGNMVIKWFTAADIGASQAVTIGAGGVAGNGGTTSLGSLLSATGGQSGGQTVGSRGQGGSVGDVIIPGAVGGAGMIGTTADQIGVGGEGGGAGGGIAAAAGSGGTFPSGGAALANSGGGGGGAAARSAGPGVIAGGADGSGILYVVEFCTS